MANSAYLTKVVEPFIVEWVSKQIGIDLHPRKLRVGRRTDGTPVHFMFDGVSNDGNVGLLVSTSHTLKPGGARKLHTDASILLNTRFRRRIMAFVNESVCTNFLNKCDGLLPLRKIEMMVCDCLPAPMTEEIVRFQTLARAEAGDKGKVWTVGKHRR